MTPESGQSSERTIAMTSKRYCKRFRDPDNACVVNCPAIVCACFSTRLASTASLRVDAWLVWKLSQIRMGPVRSNTVWPLGGRRRDDCFCTVSSRLLRAGSRTSAQQRPPCPSAVCPSEAIAIASPRGLRAKCKRRVRAGRPSGSPLRSHTFARSGQRPLAHVRWRACVILVPRCMCNLHQACLRSLRLTLVKRRARVVTFSSARGISVQWAELMQMRAHNQRPP